MITFAPKPVKELDDSYEFKPALIEIEDSPVSPLGRTTLWLLMAIIAFFVAWTCLGDIDVVVSAHGHLIPDGHVKILQPLDTGVVRQILIKEGDYVRKGQVLMQIDPSTTAPEMFSLDSNLQYANLEKSRIAAVMQGANGFGSSGIGASGLGDSAHRLNGAPPFSGGPDAESAATQRSLYTAALTKLQRDLSAKESELKRIDSEAEASRIEKEENENMLVADKQKEARMRPVVDIIPKDEYEKVENDILVHTNNIEQETHKLNQLQHQRRQVLEETERIRQEFQESNLKELAVIQKGATETRAKLLEARFKHAKQNIVAPVDGRIDKLYIHTVGGVVTPAEKLCSIVPEATPLVAKVDVENKDIGFIEAGMPVAIKVDTFDFQKYGMLDGAVALVSSDSHNDTEEGKAPAAAEPKGRVFEVYVKPKKTSLLVDGKTKELAPGMTVNAEIKVGKRKVIEFFIYPLVKYLHEGMSVR